MPNTYIAALEYASRVCGQDFWFAYYDTASFLTNPAIAELTAQSRHADPRTWGVSFLLPSLRRGAAVHP